MRSVWLDGGPDGHFPPYTRLPDMFELHLKVSIICVWIVWAYMVNCALL